MQSKRVQLERAVIHAARLLAEQPANNADRVGSALYEAELAGKYNDGYFADGEISLLTSLDVALLRLRAAVTALDALEPAAILPTEGAVNSNAPDTAKSAALQAVPITGLVRREILDEIWPLHDTDSKGLTCDELESRIRRPHTTVSSQVNWLSNNGWIEDSNFRRKTRSGRDAIVWVLTPNARSLMSGS